MSKKHGNNGNLTSVIESPNLSENSAVLETETENLQENTEEIIEKKARKGYHYVGNILYNDKTGKPISTRVLGTPYGLGTIKGWTKKILNGITGDENPLKEEDKTELEIISEKITEIHSKYSSGKTFGGKKKTTANDVTSYFDKAETSEVENILNEMLKNSQVSDMLQKKFANLQS